jgi:hypothetical protein
MGRHDGRDALGVHDAAQQLHDLADGPRVQLAGGLVGLAEM